jgi:two-component system phosphate regulon sensor histidine kinase PhoR
MVYGNHCNLIEPNKSFKSEGKLPKYDEFNYYFGVKFPSRQEDLRASTGLPWVLAMIAAITVIFFSYAIWVIFNQRRYSEMQRDFINNMTRIQDTADLHTIVQRFSLQAIGHSAG